MGKVCKFLEKNVIPTLMTFIFTIPINWKINLGYALISPSDKGKPEVTLTHPLAYVLTKNSKISRDCLKIN